MITQLMNVIVGQTTKATRAGPEISESVAVNRNSGKGCRKDVLQLFSYEIFQNC